MFRIQVLLQQLDAVEGVRLDTRVSHADALLVDEGRQPVTERRAVGVQERVGRLGRVRVDDHRLLSLYRATS